MDTYIFLIRIASTIRITFYRIVDHIRYYQLTETSVIQFVVYFQSSQIIMFTIYNLKKVNQVDFRGSLNVFYKRFYVFYLYNHVWISIKKQSTLVFNI